MGKQVFDEIYYLYQLSSTKQLLRCSSSVTKAKKKKKKIFSRFFAIALSHESLSLSIFWQVWPEEA